MNKNENKNKSIDIDIVENPYNLKLNNLITLGKRANNEKRNFLFISKVLGKHLEVIPDICRAIGFILASKIYGKSEHTEQLIKFLNNPEEYKNEAKKAMKEPYEVKENICVLGFAETATGLGMAVASAIKGAYYLTTTREDILDIKSLLNFEEEHSHATTHKCFVVDKDKVVDADRIILVDDEITTGKSMVNIIENLEETTNVKKYTVLSILDWRGKEHKELFDKVCKERSIQIEVVSLISGNITVNDKTILYDGGEAVLEESTEVINIDALERFDRETSRGKKSYFKNSGRFGMEYSCIEDLEDKCKDAALKIQHMLGDSKKTLVLGHGENIYIPSRVAAYLDGDIYFKSTTRSPIYCADEEIYPIKEKHSFSHEGVKYYLYNKKDIEKQYDKVVLITESDLNIKLTDNLVIIRL
jgi:orotate phosphoribosyltransferase